MYSFPDMEPVSCSMSSSNCCFLTSQEASQVVWYSHLFQNFPQFIVIHTDSSLVSIISLPYLHISHIYLPTQQPIFTCTVVWLSGKTKLTFLWFSLLTMYFSDQPYQGIIVSPILSTFSVDFMISVSYNILTMPLQWTSNILFFAIRSNVIVNTCTKIFTFIC